MHVFKPPPVGGLDRVPVFTAATGGTRATLFELDGVTPMPGNVLVADTSGNLPFFACAVTPVYVGTSGSRTVWNATPDQDQPLVSAAYSTFGTVDRWRQKLATNPTTCKAVAIGDSTTDNTTSAHYLWDRLRYLHTQAGESLDGMTAAQIVSQGNNGQALSDYLLTPGGGTFKYSDLVAAAPDLVIASWGLNDVRLGQCDKATLVARLTTLVTNIIRDLPNADIVLRIPNPILTTADATPLVFEADGTTTASAATCQAYSTLLRNAYMELIGLWPHVIVADLQGNVFGTQALAAHPLLANQLHPTPASSTVNNVPTGGGYVAIADYLATLIGPKRAGFPVDKQAFRWFKDDFSVATGGNGFLDLTILNTAAPNAAQFPITTADTLYVSGFAGPISLASASITRPFGGNNIRITGLTGKDFTNFLAKRAAVGFSHAGATTGDRQAVAVDLPSIAAGAFGTVTAAVTGARTGDRGDATQVLCAPPAAFVTAGLYMVNCYPSANDTATLVVWNPTGSAVDLASATFTFWVVR